MFRFTIRDLLWLMVVVGMGAYSYREQLAAQEARQAAASLTKALADERAKPRQIFVGGPAGASNQIRPGETIVLSMAKDGLSSTYWPLRVDHEKLYPNLGNDDPS